jgi:hypothetical protein
MRRPLYGGERGIQSRQQSTIDTLRVFAKSDFKHDFGEGTASRDKYTQDDLVRFKEIAQGYGLGVVRTLTTGFNDVLGNNPYTLLKSTISQQIFPSVGNDTDYMDEDDALSKIGFDAKSIKERFKAEKVKNKDTLTDTVLRIPNTVLNTPGGERTYEVSAVLIKDKEGAGVLNIASRFETVADKTKFALIVDAATISTSELINSDLTPLPKNKCKFYILENIENDSDSATKLTSAGLNKPKNPANIGLQPELFFLRDIPNTVIYPEFNLQSAGHHGEALFGNAELTLSRSGDDTEADFRFADNTTYHVGSVSTNANVKNASLNMIASALSKGGSVSDKQLVYTNPDKTPFLFPYLKRVGDWCQALSLLDGSRDYTVSDVNRNPLGQTTLDELRKDDTVIALVTVDRILLGYALSLGLDVFFTTSTDLRLMIYYKNTETQMDPAQLAAKTAEYKAESEALISQISTRDIMPGILQNAFEAIQGTQTDIDYLQMLRSVLYRVSLLRRTFGTLRAKAFQLRVSIKLTTDPKELYRAYFDLTSILRKMKDDQEHNQIQQASFTTYPELINEKSVFDGFRTGRKSRKNITDLKKILSVTMFDDAKQSEELFGIYGLNFSELLHTTPKDPDFVEIYKSLEVLRPVDTFMTGGGAITSLVDQLRTFEVTPVSESYYNTLLNSPQTIEDKPLVLIQDSYYRGYDSKPFSVLDNYLITETSHSVFEQLASKLQYATPEELQFITLRFLVLYSDQLMGRYEMIANNDAILPVVDELGNELGQQETDLNFTEHKRITFEATYLLQYVAELTKDKNYASAFMKGFNLMHGAKKWDQDTISFYQQQLMIRNNNFDLVKERILTGRISLYKLYKKYSFSQFKKRSSESISMTEEPNDPKKRQLEMTEEGSNDKRTRMGGRRPLYG